MESSEVGKFGTLRLLKRLEPGEVVASYPIDDEEITIGRDPNCSIRLYYESVSLLHCRIIFRERKAFLEVLGINGVLIDGCPVFPAITPSSGPVTVPLPNNSTIEIYKKRFQFCYPPKELRSMLLATPSPQDESASARKNRRRTLRMSMIRSAQVFSPRPSEDPRENLKILQTPLKTPFRGTHRRESSPLKRGVVMEEPEEDEEDEIVLVESNHPRVLEEDTDLVILEHVEVTEPEPPTPQQSQRLVQYPIPQAARPPPQMQQTPRRRPQPRASLHRAVLIRSAQRVAMKVEMEKEEEEEVEEVEETIAGLDEMQDVEEVEEEEYEDDGQVQADNGEPQQEGRTAVSGWRKSLGAMTGSLAWPFRSSSVPQDIDENDEHEEEQDITDAQTAEGMDEVNDENQEESRAEYDDNTVCKDEQPDFGAVQDHTDEDPPSAMSSFNPPNRPLGQFMTPQASRVSGRGRGQAHVRYSVGGFTAGGIQGLGTNTTNFRFSSTTAPSGPRRVKLVEPWKVEDLVIPLSAPEGHAEMKEEDEDLSVPSETFGTPRMSKREKLSEEERRAIQERRRSALTTPDPFFGGHTPGTGRLKSRFTSLSPSKSAAPIHALNIGEAIPEVRAEENVDTNGNEEDTQVMLARMKQMVEGVKRRQSMGPRPSVGLGLSPKKKPGEFSLLAPESNVEGINRLVSNSSSAYDRMEVEEQLLEEDEQEDASGSKENEHHDAEEYPGHEEDTDADMQGGTSSSLPQQRMPSTPKIDGIRNLFSVPRDEMQTPQMDGIRELFNHTKRVMVTPALEGVGEMLATPAGYRNTGPAVQDEKNIHEDASDEEQRTAPLPSRTGKPAGGATTKVPAAPTRRVAPRSVASQKQKQSPAEDTPSTAEEDGPSSEQSSRPTAKRGGIASRVSRKPRSKTDTAEGNTVVKSTRTRTATPDSGEQEETRGRLRSGDSSRMSTTNVEQQTGSVPKPTARRTRKAAETSPPVEPAEATTTTTTTKSLRKPRIARTPVQDEKPVPATAPAKAGTARRGTRAKPVTVDVDEEDPLDSLPRDESSEKEPGARVRRSTRSKVPTIKEEDVDDSAGLAQTVQEVGAPVPRTTRTRKTTPVPKTTTTTAKSTTSRSKIATASSSKKVPAVDPTAKQTSGSDVDGEQAGDKENTPERQSASTEEEQPEAGGSGKPASGGRTGTRSKVTRSTGKTRSAAEEEKEAEPTKTRVSRAKAGRR